MATRVTPIKDMPRVTTLGGDPYITQAALLLAALVDGHVTLRKPNRSIDTDRTVAFLESVGIRLNRTDSAIEISGRNNILLPDDSTLIFDGSVFPLTMVMGLLAGRNESCFINYSKSINQDIIDTIINTLNANGIDILHEADERLIVIRKGTEYPIEIKISSSLSYLKNCILMSGIASGRSVLVRELISGPNFFEKCVGKFRGKLTIDKPGMEVREDPRDPRRKIRTSGVDHRREISLPSSIRLHSADIEIPNDSDAISALMTLAVLKKHNVRLENIPLSSARLRLLNYLKSSGIDSHISDRRLIDGEHIGTVELEGKGFRVRKTSGEQAAELIEDIPFLAVLAASGSGTSVIRGVAEFGQWGIEPFEEIAENLSRMGAKCGILEDGLIIEGTGKLTGADFGTIRNPKVGLAFFLAALTAEGWSGFGNFEIIEKNYPDIVRIMRQNSVYGVTN